MNIPKMIIFDYGNTLVKEDVYDAKKGIQAIDKYLVYDKNVIKLSDLAEFSDMLFSEYIKKGNACGLEVLNTSCLRLMLEYFNIKCLINYSELEMIFWDNAAKGNQMEFSSELLYLLDKKEIRTGIISNISFTGDNVKKRIDDIFPNNNFEFVITSSDYVLRKPNPILYQIAINKSRLKAEEIWFCGDNFECDIVGANSVGIQPVYFCRNQEEKAKDGEEINYIKISTLNELINLVSEM